jgi:hypothetical protein
MRYLIVFASLFIVLAFLVAPAAAQPKTGYFWAEIYGDNQHWNTGFEGGGTGYNPSAPWFEYTSETAQIDKWGIPNPQPAWHNQWYYDDPLDLTRWKEVTLTFDYELMNSNANGGGIIAINYSTDNWTDTTAPPMSNTDGSGNELIGRIILENQFWVNAGDNTVHNFTQTFDLPDYGVDYNPVWISIDIAGYNVLLSSQENPGSIVHECVPEPSTFILLLMSGGVLLAVRFLRRGLV